MSLLAVQSNRNFFRRCWTGSARLWQAYWLLGFFGVFVAAALSVMITYPFWRGPQDDWWVEGLAALLLFAYLLFASISIWRCARNVSISMLGKLARMAVLVPWVLIAGIAIWAAL